MERGRGGGGLNVGVDWEIVWRLSAASALAGIIGLDRELAGKAAGLRTHMMVGLGAAAFTSVAVGLIGDVSGTDPARMITGIATGIGFLGAGSIIKAGGEVEGITTAAGIWVVGAVGAACGVGAYPLAVNDHDPGHAHPGHRRADRDAEQAPSGPAPGDAGRTAPCRRRNREGIDAVN